MSPILSPINLSPFPESIAEIDSSIWFSVNCHFSLGRPDCLNKVLYLFFLPIFLAIKSATFKVPALA